MRKHRDILLYLGAVVHARAEVIWNVEHDDLAPSSCLEVVQLALGDVCLVNDDIDVTIWTTLFVPESDRVANLVRYCSVLYHQVYRITELTE